MVEEVSKEENQVDNLSTSEKIKYNIPDEIIFEFVDDEGEDEQRPE